MFCDEHGTIDYCPECVTQESTRISREEAEALIEQQFKLLDSSASTSKQDDRLTHPSKYCWHYGREELKRLLDAIYKEI